MLAIHAVGDVFWLVNLVQNPVSVVLHRRREDDNFVQLRHLFEELLTARTDAELALTAGLVVVNERFIKVKHQTVAIRVFGWRQIGWVHWG